jgi:hypothetical protein
MLHELLHMENKVNEGMIEWQKLREKNGTI